MTNGYRIVLFGQTHHCCCRFCGQTCPTLFFLFLFFDKFDKKATDLFFLSSFVFHLFEFSVCFYKIVYKKKREKKRKLEFCFLSKLIFAFHSGHHHHQYINNKKSRRKKNRSCHRYLFSFHLFIHSQ